MAGPGIRSSSRFRDGVRGSRNDVIILLSMGDWRSTILGTHGVFRSYEVDSRL
jgi:hypothetical protein